MTAPCLICGADTGVEMPVDGLAARMVRLLRCDRCEDEMVAVDHDREAEAARSAHAKQISATIPRQLRTYNFQTSPAPPAAIRAAEAWAREGGRLVCIGQVGRGKTGLMASAASERLRTTRLRWASVPNLLQALMSDFKSEARQDAQRLLSGSTGICLDDLDKFNGSDWAAQQIFAAIDNVIASGADLFVTSNKSPGQIARHIGGDFGQAIASRLASCEIVVVEGEDHRLHRRAA